MTRIRSCRRLGHLSGQSHLAIVAMAIPTAVWIFPISSPSPPGSADLIADFSSSVTAGGEKCFDSSVQCSLTYFLRITADICLQAHAYVRHKAQRCNIYWKSSFPNRKFQGRGHEEKMRDQLMCYRRKALTLNQFIKPG